MPDLRPTPTLRIAQAATLLLLAGLLLARRDFAHLNLGDLFTLINQTPPQILTKAFITETILLFLFPIAIWQARRRYQCAKGESVPEKCAGAFGWTFFLPLAFTAWGAAHALIALLNHADPYLIIRQSALALYPLFFVYAFLFLGTTEKEIRFVAKFAIATALLCAALDTFHLLDPKPQPPPAEWMPVYGQQTLPLAILALGLFIAAKNSWLLRALALIGLLFAAWRQSARPMQSVIPISIAGAFAILFLIAIFLAAKGQRFTLKRTALCFLLFITLGSAYRLARSQFNKSPPSETTAEVKAWNLTQYADLFTLFDQIKPPTDPAKRMISRRPPYVPVEDPEVYKLEAVFEATPSVSTRNNIWRFLVWRKMLGDWSEGHPILGAGVGKSWLYPALYQSRFHWGEEREGLDPHNSYLNTLYRYGLIGLALLLATIIAIFTTAIKALKKKEGDPLLEGLLLYFTYTAVFAFFTVGLEGPPYSMPFWLTLGLIASRAKRAVSPLSP